MRAWAETTDSKVLGVWGLRGHLRTHYISPCCGPGSWGDCQGLGQHGGLGTSGPWVGVPAQWGHAMPSPVLCPAGATSLWGRAVRRAGMSPPQSRCRGRPGQGLLPRVPAGSPHSPRGGGSRGMVLWFVCRKPPTAPLAMGSKHFVLSAPVHPSACPPLRVPHLHESTHVL